MFKSVSRLTKRLNHNSWQSYAISLLLTILLSVALISILPTKIFTNLIFDNLTYSTPRPEIIILGIDDKSLNELGSWPWDREIFAEVVKKLFKAEAKVVGFDILFLEERSGDDIFRQAIKDNESFTKVVFASKLVKQKNNIYDLTPIETIGNVSSGFVNFDTDTDGKIRKVIPFTQLNTGCVSALGLEIFKNYLPDGFVEINCKDQYIKILKNTISISNNQTLRFTQSFDNFTTIPIVDVIADRVDLDMLKNKIVIIGSTALDLRLGLNDNFLDVFGKTIPGVKLHADVVNSFLNNQFINEISQNTQLILFWVIVLGSSLFYKNIGRLKLQVVFFIFSLLFTFIIFVLLANQNIYFEFTNLIILQFIVFIFNTVYLYIQQKLKNKFITDAFGQYLNPTLLKELIKDPNLLKLGGVTKNMTVMFSDVRSFTTISEGLSSEELVYMLNLYLEEMSQIIIAHNGTIDKYIGDAIMAFWNAPIEETNHALLSVRTALDMQLALDQFNAKYINIFPKLSIGIGINSGEMTVGNIGGNKRFDYTVIGDNVNLSSRLEGLTKKYGVCTCISQSVIDAIKVDHDEILFRKLDVVIVKGKTEPVTIYEPMLNNTKNLEIKDKYEIALSYYQKYDFDNAILNLRDNDNAAKKLKERIILLKENPQLLEKFIKNQGVWEWEEK
jgi:adenylate cyclase